MRIRLVVAACLACSLITTEAAAPAVAAPKRVFKGKTAQKRKVRLAVGRNSMKMLRFTIDLQCRNGTTLVVDESGFQPTPLRGRRFRDVQFGRTDTVFFRGRVTARGVRGRLRVKDRLKSGVRCSSRWVAFRARR
jgi:hypothetical protein